MFSQSKYKTGILFYDEIINRINIQFDDDTLYGGLDCGEFFEIKDSDHWIPVRIELGTNWFLVDEYENRLNIALHGLQIRIELNQT